MHGLAVKKGPHDWVYVYGGVPPPVKNNRHGYNFCAYILLGSWALESPTTIDSLTSLGFAGNVVQFVDFVLTRCSASTEMADSARETTAENLELENVYTRGLLELANSRSVLPTDRHLTDDALMEEPHQGYPSACRRHPTNSG